MIARSAPRIFVSAGEPSGDLHGAGVVRALLARHPDAKVEALGGPLMQAAGATLRYRMEGLAAFGVVEVVSKLGAHWRLLRAMRDDFRAGRYDLAILIDYPGFHVRVAEAARKAGTKVLYYIAPQLWAWRPGRARRFAAAVDRLAVVLPFEQSFFGRLGLRSDYVGHPLIDREPLPTREEARARLGVPAEGRVLGIFPGSRAQEVRRLWAPFRDAALQLLRRGTVRSRPRGGGGGRRVSRSGSAHRGPGRLRSGDRGVRRAARQVGDDDARGRARRPTDGRRLQGAPVDLSAVPAAAHGAVGEPGEPGGRARSRPRDPPGAGRRRAIWRTRSVRCSIPPIPGPRPSARDSRWFGDAWASREPRQRVVALADELLGA